MSPLPSTRPKTSIENMKEFNNHEDSGRRNELYRLGCAHHEGLGVPRSFELACRYFSEASTLGCADSMRMLGYLFRDGANKDLEKAKHWWSSAAMSGCAISQAELFNLYASGYFGLNEPQIVEAFAWGNIAACQKEAQTVSWSGWRASFRAFEAKMSAAQVRLGEARSVHLFAKIQSR